VANYKCPQCKGESDAEWAEANWRDVDGKLCCSAYCAAKQGGADEEKAQKARAKHTEKAAGKLREQRVAEARALLEAEGEL
jgi:protein gp37